MNKTLTAIIVLLILGVGGFLLLKSQTITPTSQIQPRGELKTLTEQFSNPKKSAHYESNTPEHGVTLAGVPVNIVINFNFDLVKGSEIKIETDGKDYGVGQTVIDTNKLALRRKMDANAKDGLYTVYYKACWADSSCHDGNFQFKIDRSIESDFKDMTGQKEVKINLHNIVFNPAKIKVSKGTKITWQNLDSVVHTVNTDAHPQHTYYVNQNSRDLNRGDQYAVTFSEPGIYLYHCTPHATTMHGQVLVE